MGGQPSRPDPPLPAEDHRILGHYPYDPKWMPGEQLTWIRRYFGLSQEAMARRLRVDPGTLARWERGLKGDHLRRLEKIIGGSIPGVAKHPPRFTLREA